MPRVRRPLRRGAVRRPPARPTSTCRASSPPSRPAIRRALRRRSSPRTSSAARARASAPSRCCASATASWCTRAAARSRSGPCSATRRTGRTSAACRSARAPPNGKRVAVIGAGPRGSPPPASSARAATASPSTTSARRSAGLVRYAIAPYRQTNEPLPDEARRSPTWASSSASTTRVDAARLRRARGRRSTRSSSRSGMGADVDAAYEGDELEGVWESLPFIERLKTGEPPPSARASP